MPMSSWCLGVHGMAWKFGRCLVKIWTLLASSLLNIITLVSWAKVVSTFGIGCVSRKTFSLSGFISTQILTAPEGLGTTNIAAHQAVGSLTRDITPKASMHCNSVCTFCLEAKGYFLVCLMHMVEHWALN